MIIDSHVHVFPNLGGSSGFSDAKQHSKYTQHNMASHHQPIRDMSDNSIVRIQTLCQENDFSLAGLNKVDFRGAGYGRMAWTFNGKDNYIQYLPPNITGLSAPPELMIAQMDYVGIDKAVLQTGHLYGRLNKYLSNAIKKFPDRFWGLAMVDEWKADSMSQLKVIDRLINKLELDGLWFQTSNLELHGRSETIDDPIFYPFWDHIRNLNIPIYMNVTSANPGPDAYLKQLKAFDNWLHKYTDIPVVYPHGLSLFRFKHKDSFAIPEKAWKPLMAPNLIVEILIPIFQGAIWEYPFVESRPIIKEYYTRLGAEKLAWGSDMPNVERHCTYKQSLDYLRNHCKFISPTDMQKICGGNLYKLFSNRHINN